MSERYARLFWILTGCFVVAEILSWTSFQIPGLMPIMATGLLLGLGLIGLRWPWVPALVSLAELVVGGKGYLWFWSVGETRISFRLGLFGVLVVLAGWQILRQRHWPKIPVQIPTAIFLGWISVMSVVGGLHGFGWSNVFFDVNGFLFFGMLWTWAILFPTYPAWKDVALTTLLAGVTVMAVKTGLMMYLFSHQPGNIAAVYHWIRDSGVGEITRIREPEYRVFFQSHIYSLFALLLTLGAFLHAKAPRWWMWPMMAGAFGTYVSLSRSLWLGLLAGLMVLLVTTIRQLGWRHLRRGLILLPLGASVWLLSTLAYNWPYIFPAPGHGVSTVAVSRLQASDALAASNARLNQLGPLQAAIQHSPVIGYGFGKTVTYYSTDPRVKGWRTTSAFELGYHDMLLKFGLIGLGLLAWVGWSMWKIIHRSQHAWLWLSGGVALLVLHATTPYLNHPLGIGWLVLATVYAAHDR